MRKGNERREGRERRATEKARRQAARKARKGGITEAYRVTVQSIRC